MSGLSKPVGSTQILAYTSGTDPFEQAHTYLTHLKEVARQPVETPATLKGRAIVLVGASSAGKSTIIHSLRTLDKEMLEEGADLTGAHFIYEFMNQNYHRYGVSKTERLAERNRKALSGETGLNEKRIGTFPFTQYATLVRPKKPTDSEDQVIDHVTKKQAIAAYHANSNKDEIPQEEFLVAFGFDPADPEDRMISFVPRKTYDMIVDTSDPKFGSTPAERGDAIAKAILS